MPAAGFQPAIPANKLRQNYALELTATGIGKNYELLNKISHFLYVLF
jgi:hypothetical protein